MKTPLDIRAVVDAHRQKYARSCSPSLVELILKIEEIVPSDYYEQQDTYRDVNVGLSVFADRTIEGVTFFRHDERKDGPFAARIATEWKNRRLFAAYTLNDGSTTDYHGWIIADMKADEAFLLSKYSELGNGEGFRTAESTLLLSEAIPPKITDLLFYTLPSESRS